MRHVATIIVFLLLCNVVLASDSDNTPLLELNHLVCRKDIRVPDIPGMITLKGDFHTHTVFSDAFVWPTMRVTEAWEDGLDAVAITDHIEKFPNKKNLNGNDDSSYETALPVAKEYGILLVRGAELTRDMPDGHHNALFITDASALDTPKFDKAMKAAFRQGAFIIWNHPGWKFMQPDKTEWLDSQQALLEKGWLHGIEVFNYNEWYPVALGWCIDKNLTVFANSDAHYPISREYGASVGHRPMTLVFAKDRTMESLREAMFAGRTVAWFGNHLAGKQEYLEALFKQSITVHAPHYVSKEGVHWVQIANDSDIAYMLQGLDPVWNGSITLPARSTQMLMIYGKTSSLNLSITNLHINLNESLTTAITIPEQNQ